MIVNGSVIPILSDELSPGLFAGLSLFGVGFLDLGFGAPKNKVGSTATAPSAL